MRPFPELDLHKTVAPSPCLIRLNGIAEFASILLRVEPTASVGRSAPNILVAG